MYQKTIILLCFVFLYLSSLNAQHDPLKSYTSNGMLGQSGLVIIPTAQLSVDRTVALGWSYVPLLETVRKISTDDSQPEFIRSARINFLPFLELSIRFTKTKEINELGDRSIFARVQVLKETEKRPALAIGAHDIIGQIPHYHSLYAVVSKHFFLQNNVVFGGHLGYGVKTREQVKNDQLLGLFAGGTFRYHFIEAGLEYDGEQTNAALKVFWKKWISISANLLDLKHLGCSANVYFNI